MGAWRQFQRSFGDRWGVSWTGRWCITGPRAETLNIHTRTHRGGGNQSKWRKVTKAQYCLKVWINDLSMGITVTFSVSLERHLCNHCFGQLRRVHRDILTILQDVLKQSVASGWWCWALGTLFQRKTTWPLLAIVFGINTNGHQRMVLSNFGDL